jgi:hypothetical protein
MKVGDILVFTKNIGYDGQYYTPGKYYRIFKISNDFIPGTICGWIHDDEGGKVYFRENEAEDGSWKFLKNIRKEKLKKISLC